MMPTICITILLSLFIVLSSCLTLSDLRSLDFCNDELDGFRKCTIGDTKVDFPMIDGIVARVSKNSYRAIANHGNYTGYWICKSPFHVDSTCDEACLRFNGTGILKCKGDSWYCQEKSCSDNAICTCNSADYRSNDEWYVIGIDGIKRVDTPKKVRFGNDRSDSVTRFNKFPHTREEMANVFYNNVLKVNSIDANTTHVGMRLLSIGDLNTVNLTISASACIAADIYSMSFRCTFDSIYIGSYLRMIVSNEVVLVKILSTFAYYSLPINWMSKDDNVIFQVEDLFGYIRMYSIFPKVARKECVTPNLLSKDAVVFAFDKDCANWLFTSLVMIMLFIMLIMFFVIAGCIFKAIVLIDASCRASHNICVRMCKLFLFVPNLVWCSIKRLYSCRYTKVKQIDELKAPLLIQVEEIKKVQPKARKPKPQQSNIISYGPAKPVVLVISLLCCICYVRADINIDDCNVGALVYTDSNLCTIHGNGNGYTCHVMTNGFFPVTHAGGSACLDIRSKATDIEPSKPQGRIKSHVKNIRVRGRFDAYYISHDFFNFGRSYTACHSEWVCHNSDPGLCAYGDPIWTRDCDPGNKFFEFNQLLSLSPGESVRARRTLGVNHGCWLQTTESCAFARNALIKGGKTAWAFVLRDFVYEPMVEVSMSTGTIDRIMFSGIMRVGDTVGFENFDLSLITMGTPLVNRSPPKYMIRSLAGNSTVPDLLKTYFTESIAIAGSPQTDIFGDVQETYIPLPIVVPNDLRHAFIFSDTNCPIVIEGDGDSNFDSCKTSALWESRTVLNQMKTQQDIYNGALWYVEHENVHGSDIIANNAVDTSLLFSFRTRSPVTIDVVETIVCPHVHGSLVYVMTGCYNCKSGASIKVIMSSTCGINFVSAYAPTLSTSVSLESHNIKLYNYTSEITISFVSSIASVPSFSIIFVGSPVAPNATITVSGELNAPDVEFTSANRTLNTHLVMNAPNPGFNFDVPDPSIGDGIGNFLSIFGDLGKWWNSGIWGKIGSMLLFIVVGLIILFVALWLASFLLSVDWTRFCKRKQPEVSREKDH